ncbi:fimbria/pilus outer membrane usher protein [Cupriavidus pauculus]|uniref:Fimbrial biogenesis outer membrane usher protein n=1 Tax=Cupriavidus pauculus TaxID=82633 RepID=A0A3G8GWB0_9BURK|nr:fimbria/pilus outer membrane usher protein [Cupriavidus pauculus]AZG12384.1 fimbrial biogenesis outer membrane usher protein [Cupriavidus pauculus]
MRTRSPRRLAARCLVASTVLPAPVLAEVLAETPATETLAQVRFNAQFLRRADGSSVDVSRFDKGNPVAPGSYPVDIYLNDTWIARETVRFAGPDDAAAPCLDPATLSRLNLNEEALPPAGRTAIADAAASAAAGAADGACLHPAAISDDVTWSFSVNDMRLNFTVAQALMRRRAAGTVPHELLDSGVPSATLGYQLNTFGMNGAQHSTNTYLGIDAGLNVAGWHLRQRSSMSWQSVGERYAYQNIATYVQRDLPKWRSQLTLGDAFTDGAVFDSFSVRGVNLATDDRMLPDSTRGYAPLVRGVARTNARVSVSQDGNKIYETTVAPGPFEIDDLHATGYGGNLLVTVTEADGSQSSFTVPYASVVQLIRPGLTRYSATVGEYRSGSHTTPSREKLVQGTVQHGFSNLTTGYAGAVLSEGYQAALIGAAFNLPIGAFALDATHARAKIPGANDASGQSFRISYSKYVPTTSTNLTVAAYRYATKGFWSMRDAFAARDGSYNGDGVARQRSQLQLTLNQNLGGRLGTLYATGTSTAYWNRRDTALMFQAGYSNTLRLFGTNMTFNVSASRLRDAYTGRYTTQVFANLTAPLGRSAHAPLVSFGTTHDNGGGSSQQLMLSGTALEDNAVSYGLNVNRAAGSKVSGGGNVQYRSPYTTVSASASGGNGYTQYSAGLQGALVAHAGGVTLANFLGDTIGIVEAKGASGARVANAPGVRIDRFGYAIVPYLHPYSMNTIQLDPKGLPLDVSLDATSTQVAPRANAAVKIRFAAVTGRSAIVSATRPDGGKLPFGAQVTNGAGAEVGVVGQSGIIFARGLDNVDRLYVTWGAGGTQRCAIDVNLPDSTRHATAYAQIRAVCQPDAKETP